MGEINRYYNMYSKIYDGTAIITKINTKGKIIPSNSNRENSHYGKKLTIFYGIKALLKYVELSSVLDVGCGRNNACSLLSENYGIRTVGLDIASPYADIIANALDLSSLFEENSFDLVASSSFLEHLAPDDAIKCLNEMSKVAMYFFYAITIIKGDRFINGHKEHLCVKPMKWWKKQIEQNNGRVGITRFCKRGDITCREKEAVRVIVAGEFNKKEKSINWGEISMPLILNGIKIVKENGQKDTKSRTCGYAK